MAAEPLPLLVQRHHEEVGPLQGLQHLGRPGGTTQRCVAQRPGQQLQRRGADQQVALRRSQRGEHLVRDVVEDVSVVRPDPSRSPTLARSQGQAGQLKARRPPLGLLPHRLGHGRAGIGRRDLREQCQRLVQGEPQVLARSSATSPRTRIRARGRGGSTRLARTTLRLAGR